MVSEKVSRRASESPMFATVMSWPVMMHAVSVVPASSSHRRKPSLIASRVHVKARRTAAAYEAPVVVLKEVGRESGICVCRVVKNSRRVYSIACTQPNVSDQQQLQPKKEGGEGNVAAMQGIDDEAGVQSISSQSSGRDRRAD